MPSQSIVKEFFELHKISSYVTKCVDVGNSHIVIYTKVPLSANDKLQDKELFVDEVIVNFTEVKGNTIHLSVCEWMESSLTFTCGNGACGTFAAGLKLGITKCPCEFLTWDVD